MFHKLTAINAKHIAHREVFNGSPEQITLKTIARVSQLLLIQFEQGEIIKGVKQ